MTTTFKTIDYYYITVPNRSGEAARVTKALANHDVNLLAFHAFPIDHDQAQLNFCPENAAAFRQAVETEGITVTGPKKVLLAQGNDGPGVINEILEELTTVQVNCTACSAIATGTGTFGLLLWVPPTDWDKAWKTLGTTT